MLAGKRSCRRFVVHRTNGLRWSRKRRIRRVHHGLCQHCCDRTVSACQPQLGDRHWDRLWGAIQELGAPVSFHIASQDSLGETDVREDKVKIGKNEATYQDISGTLLKKFPPFDPNAKITKVENYRQIYVIFEGKDAVYSLTLLGPAKTVEKHKKEFDEWLKNFK